MEPKTEELSDIVERTIPPALARAMLGVAALVGYALGRATRQYIHRRARRSIQDIAYGVSDEPKEPIPWEEPQGYDELEVV